MAQTKDEKYLSHYRATQKYKKTNAVRLSIELNRNTEADIIERIEVAKMNGETVSSFIKRLIREDIDRMLSY